MHEQSSVSVACKGRLERGWDGAEGGDCSDPTLEFSAGCIN